MLLNNDIYYEEMKLHTLHKTRKNMSYLQKLKKQSKNADVLNKLVEKSKKASNNSNTEDNRFWRVDRGKDGNAYAIIRFLPIPEVDSEEEKAMPWVVKYNHGFKGPTGLWYIEDSLTTIGKQDAISVMNRQLWNSGSEADVEKAKKQKRKTQYFSNIYVVKDPADPSNEGKVFLFKYGKKIFDKIMTIINPDPTFDDEPSDPFDIFEGRDFKLKIRTVDGYPNYDLSEFTKTKAITNPDGSEMSETELEKVLSSQHSLLDLISPDKFKTPEELEERLKLVLAEDGDNIMDRPSLKKEEKKTTKVVEEDEEDDYEKLVKETEKSSPMTSSDEDDDEINLDKLLEGLDD